MNAGLDYFSLLGTNWAFHLKAFPEARKILSPCQPIQTVYLPTVCGIREASEEEKHGLIETGKNISCGKKELLSTS